MDGPLPDAARRALHAVGLTPVEVLGAGMEGVVVEVGDGRVAKVWSHSSTAAARRLQAFYEALHEAGPELDTPRIHEVLASDGLVITVEDRLAGQPLRSTMDDDEHHVTDVHLAAITSTLRALAAVEPDPRLRILPILPGEHPFDGADSFGNALADFVERRSSRHHATLAAAVDELDPVISAVTASLRRIRSRDGLLHGDLIPANIFTGSSRTAVLDFGFLTTIGDPCFDAAVAATVYDMYGPRHRDNERLIDEALSAEFGYGTQLVLTYRAAYALVTSNHFSASAGDGHFRWCAAILNRRDVRDALDL